MAATLEELLTLVPPGSQYDAVRNAIQRVADTFPSRLSQITPARVGGWVNEIDTGSGKGRDADQIRDDIFEYIVTESVIMEVLGVDANTAQQLIAGGNDGGMNFSELNIVNGTVVPQGEGPPSGIMSGGTFTIIKSRSDEPDKYAMTYVVDGVQHVYMFDSLESAAAIMGDPHANGSMVIYDDSLDDGDTWVMGPAESLSGQDGSYQVYFGDIMKEAALEAGVRDPNKLSALYADPKVQQLMAEQATAGHSDEWLWAEIRQTDVYLALYPGIDVILKRGSTNPEAEWRQYYNDTSSSLKAMGMEPGADGSYDQYMGEMLVAGIDADELAAYAPVYVRAKESPQYAAALNEWVKYETGSELTFDQWVDVMAGTSDPQIAAIVERATIQFQGEQRTSSLTPEQIKRIADQTQLSEAQIVVAFSNAEEMLLSVGTPYLERYGLTEEMLVNAAFGITGDSSGQGSGGAAPGAGTAPSGGSASGGNGSAPPRVGPSAGVPVNEDGVPVTDTGVSKPTPGMPASATNGGAGDGSTSPGPSSGGAAPGAGTIPANGGPPPDSGSDGPVLSPEEVIRRARKAAIELGLMDDPKAQFFVGFDRFSRPQRQGLLASAPEAG